MRLETITDMQAGYAMGMDKEGREYLVVCLKGTYTIPTDGATPQLAKEQLPLVEADTFTGDPGYSTPAYESDYPPFKPRCDILLNGSAYSPGGRPAVRVPVSLQFGRMTKSFRVVGNRTWKYSMRMPVAGDPEPFVRMPISYDCAFGGVDDSRGNPEQVRTIVENPVGVGYHCHIDKISLCDQPLPNTEELNCTISSPDKKYRPMAFGPVGRGWQPRASLAGTYDQNWMDDIFPFLPPDFDQAYYQAAPPDQQVSYPQGGEPVVLTNLHPDGRIAFPFPRISARAWFFLKSGEELENRAEVDTVMLMPDEGRFTVTCRTALPLKRNMMEVDLVVVGHEPYDKYQVVPENEAAFALADADQDDAGKVGDAQDGRDD